MKQLAFLPMLLALAVSTLAAEDALSLGQDFTRADGAILVIGSSADSGQGGRGRGTVLGDEESPVGIVEGRGRLDSTSEFSLYDLSPTTSD